jgi:hypothetical protein
LCFFVEVVGKTENRKQIEKVTVRRKVVMRMVGKVRKEEVERK